MPRLIKRERLLAELRAPNVTLEMLQRCVDEGDNTLHRVLLNVPDLPRGIIEALREKGANKAVRNIAGVRLKNERYRA